MAETKTDNTNKAGDAGTADEVDPAQIQGAGTIVESPGHGKASALTTRKGEKANDRKPAAMKSAGNVDSLTEKVADDDDNALVTVKEDVYEEFVFPNTVRKAYRLVAAKGTQIRAGELRRISENAKAQEETGPRATETK